MGNGLVLGETNVLNACDRRVPAFALGHESVWMLIPLLKITNSKS